MGASPRSLRSAFGRPSLSGAYSHRGARYRLHRSLDGFLVGTGVGSGSCCALCLVPGDAVVCRLLGWAWVWCANEPPLLPATIWSAGRLAGRSSPFRCKPPSLLFRAGGLQLGKPSLVRDPTL